MPILGFLPHRKSTKAPAPPPPHAKSRMAARSEPMSAWGKMLPIFMPV